MPLDYQTSYYEYKIPTADALTNALTYSYVIIPKVQLFFDVNGTITIKDSSKFKTTGLSDEQLYILLCIDVAKQIEREWEPSLGKMYFVSYVEKHLLPIDSKCSSEERRAIRELRDLEYRNIFNRLPESEKEKWEAKIQLAMEKYKALGEDKIFPSFFNLLEKVKNDKSVQIVLRTFGSDAKDVIKDINDRFGPFFHLPIYTLTRLDEQHFRLGIEGEEKYEIIKRENLALRIYALGNCAIRDDFTTWDLHGQQSAYGKPFPIDRNPQLTRLFFDDWAGFNQIMSPFDAYSGKEISLPDGLAPSTSAIEALINDEFYVNFINKDYICL